MSAQETAGLPSTSPRSAKIALDLFILDGVEWGELDAAKRRDLSDALARSNLRSSSPNRYGFTSVRLTGNAIFGLYSQEYLDLVPQYDARKARVETTQAKFVELVFLVDTSSGFLMLQDRKFHNEGTLSMGESRRRFSDSLNRSLRRVNLPAALMREREYVTVSQEQFVDIIRTEEVWELDIEQLQGRPVPDDLPLFNSDPAHEEFYREIWNARERPNISNVSIRRSQDGDLRRSIFARAASFAGQVKKVVYAAGEPGLRQRRELMKKRKTHVGGISIRRPPNDTDARRILEIIANLVVGTVEEPHTQAG